MTKKVFISHPYSDNPQENKEKCEIICKKLFEKGDVIPISPLHLFSFVDDESGKRDDILDSCFRIITVCDEMWVFGDSDGCQREVEFAKMIGVPVINKKEGDLYEN